MATLTRAKDSNCPLFGVGVPFNKNVLPTYGDILRQYMFTRNNLKWEGEQIFENTFNNFSYQSPLIINSYESNITVNLKMEHFQNPKDPKEETKALEIVDNVDSVVVLAFKCIKLVARIEHKMINTDQSLDSILEKLGHFGKYQCFVVGLFSIAVMLHSAVYITFVFTTKDLNYRCKVPNCENIPSEYNSSWVQNAIPVKKDLLARCERFPHLNTAECNYLDFNRSIVEKCDDYVYDTKKITLVQDFHLQCDENLWKLTLIGTINGLGQLFGLPLSGYVSDRYGRLTALICGMALAGCCGIIRSFTTTYYSFAVFEFFDAMFGVGVYSCGFILGKFGAAAAFLTCYVITSEMFPTGLRHSLMSICSMFGRIGSLIAPQMPLLAQLWKPLPLILFAVMAAISGVLSLYFPETNNIELPDTIQQAEELKNHKHKKHLETLLFFAISLILPDKKQMLKRMPRKYREDNEWTNAVVDMISDMQNAKKPALKKSSKVSVLAGKNVSVEDYEHPKSEESEVNDNVEHLPLESNSEDGQEELMGPETENDGEDNGNDDPKFAIPTLENISVDNFLEIKLEVESEHKLKRKV
ncbi:hypothetical protein RN001_006743 [Aquatica leii]|uniref:Uncharacterized protein n=1 Tax=Aquatica leii TaxID=1421715 RepID=A0AAN7SK08_9COLE|nr:hypothetical protein RN001_006743 [Aquatica leii]